MLSPKQQRGSVGEKAAVKYLKGQGYKILERNFSCKSGEIDIIAMDKDVMAFVEVKLRSRSDFGLPQEMVTPQKQQRIRKTTEYYLMKKRIEPFVRFDVVAILGEVDGKKLKIEGIELIKDAF